MDTDSSIGHTKHEVRVIGTDPGLTNHGICHLAYYGEKLIKDESGQFIKMPLFKILNWCLWDLKRVISYSQNPQTMAIVRNKYTSTNNNQPLESLIHLGDTASLFGSSHEWIYETYRSALYGKGTEDVLPAIVTELQCSMIKNHEIEVTMVSHILPWVIKSIDRSKGVDTREVLSRAKKYGIPSDGTLSYNERKAKSEEVTRSLLQMAGMNKEICFLNALKAARKRDVPGKPPQAHDACDAFLIALEECKNRHAALMKKLGITASEEVVEEVAQPFSVTINDDDDSDQEALFPKKQRKKRAPSVTKRAKAVNAGFVEHTKKKTSAMTKRVQAVNASFDEQTKKRKAVVPAKPRQKKKARIEQVVEEEEDTISFDEAMTPKKVDVSKKYPQLLFMDS